MFITVGGAAKAVYYISIYVLWDMTYTIMDIPYWSMIPSLSTTEEERNKISSLARVCTGIGGMIVTVGVPLIVGEEGKFEPERYLLVTLIICAAYLVFMLYNAAFTKEEVEVPTSKVRFREIIPTLRKNDQLSWYMVFITLIYTAMNITAGFGMYFFTYAIRNFSLTGIFSAVVFGGYGLGMFLYPFVCRKLTAKKTFALSVIMGIAGYIMLFIATALFGSKMGYTEGGFLNMSAEGLQVFLLISGLGITAFLGFGALSVNATVMLADIVDYGEIKLGKRTDSLIFAMQSFMYKIAGATGALIIGLALAAIGQELREPESDVDAELAAWAVPMLLTVMFGIPSVLLLISLALYNRKYKITDEFKKRMLEELAAIRSSDT